MKNPASCPAPTAASSKARNAQASVDVNSRLIVTGHISQGSNDQREMAPSLAQLQRQEEHLGKVDSLLADAGYFRENNVKAVCQHGILPAISTHRERHNRPLMERFQPVPTPPASDDPVAEMKSRLRTPAGNALYAKRKSTIEPTFGLIKQVQGFRQFLLRGVGSVSGEWNLVCIGYNLKRMFELKA